MLKITAFIHHLRYEKKTFKKRNKEINIILFKIKLEETNKFVKTILKKQNKKKHLLKFDTSCSCPLKIVCIHS